MDKVSNVPIYNENFKPVFKADSKSQFRDFTCNYGKFQNSTSDVNLIKSDFFIDMTSFQNANKNNHTLKREFSLIYDKQGFIGKSYDAIKNILGFKTGSSYVIKSLKENENNDKSNYQTIETIEKYYNSQNRTLDFAADIASSVCGLGTFALAMNVFAASLPVGLLAAAGIGAISKAVVKKSDALSAKRDYKSFNYDLVTGSINGVLSPIVSGLGNSFISKFSKLFGVKTINSSALPTGIKQIDSKIAQYIFCPKQKIKASHTIKLLFVSLSKTIEAASKMGLAFIMRKLAFDYFTNDPLKNFSALKCSQIFFADNYFNDEKINKMDLSNEM